MDINVQKLVEGLINLDPKPGEVQNRFNRIYDLIHRYGNSDHVDFNSFDLADIHLTIEEVLIYDPEFDENEPDNPVDGFYRTFETRTRIEKLKSAEGDKNDFI